MCAIIGFNGKINNQILRRLYAEARPFGHHSIGLVYYDDNGRLNVFKRAVDPLVFLRNHNHRVKHASKSPLGYGHVRYATHGAITDENSHPFQYSQNGRLITFAHNGVIQNYRQIAAEKGLGNIQVDSQCLGPLIVDKELGRSEGSTGVIWVENHELFVYRHDQGLECAVISVYGQPATFIASRLCMLSNLVASNTNLRLINRIPIDEHVAYKVTDKGLESVWHNLKMADKGKVYFPQCSAPRYLPASRVTSVSFEPKVMYTTSATENRPNLDDDPEETTARQLGEAHKVFIIFTDDGRCQIFGNSEDQVYEAINEFISSNANSTLVGGSSVGDEWTSTKLAECTADGIKYHDKKAQLLCEMASA